MKLRSFAAAVFAGAALSAATVTDETPRHSPQPGVYRIMFTGNSITMHGFNEGTIRDLGWDRQCGMAASKLENDYVHLFAARVAETRPGERIEICYNSSNACKTAEGRAEADRKTAALLPDLVILQAGEGAGGLSADEFEKWRAGYRTMLESCLALKPTPRVIAVGVWSPTGSGQAEYAPGSGEAKVEEAQREVCTELGVPFVSIARYAQNPACSGTGSSGGVKWHPNDAGMKGYADALFDAYRKTPGKPAIFTFDNPEALKGWSHTPELATELRPGFVRLLGRGGDAKIYRAITLPAGEYRVSGCGRGSNLTVALSRGWETPFFLLQLSNGNLEKWRSDSRPLKLEKEEKLMLSVFSSSADSKTNIAELKSVILTPESASTDEAGLPTPEVLGSRRPSPAVVRGFTLQNRDGLEEARNEWNANVVRKWIPAPDLTDDTVFKQRMTEIGEYLAEARKHRLKVILAVDAAAFSGNSKADVSHNAFWSDPGLADRAAALWKRIAAALTPYRDVIYAYDLCNEPLDWDQMPFPPKEWRPTAIAATRAIRSVDPDTWIMYEPGPGGLHDGFQGLKPLPDEKVIYSVHYYSPHDFTHQGIHNITGTDLKEVQAKINVRCGWDREKIRKHLQSVRDFEQKYRVPILVGEFSVVRWAPKEDAERYLADLVELFEEFGWSWCYHGLRDYHGWSLLHTETYGDLTPAKEETRRSRIIRAGLRKNLE